MGTGWVGNANQGSAVALSSDGNTGLVSGAQDNAAAGAVWVFTRSGSTWTQQGSKLFGTGAVGTAEQGWSVSIAGNGNKAIVGGYRDNGYVGAIWVFNRNGSTWTQQGGKIIGTGANGNAHQGKSVSVSADGRTVIVGGPLDNSGIGAAWAFYDPTTAVGEAGGISAEFALDQNYPNPFNPSTTIRYALPQKSAVALTVHNTVGEQVATLVRGEQEAGRHEVRFDATGMSSGVYLCRLQAGESVQTIKLLLLR